MNLQSKIGQNDLPATDLICIGETLIDFIGAQVETPINETKDYHRYLGGSPTNVAMNMARLGMNVAMVSSIGDDGFGTLTRASRSGRGADDAALSALAGLRHRHPPPRASGNSRAR